ncbi:MAG: type II toxin-antitoxin system RelE/ParE family toxin [Pseudomonadota bacterium]|nr:type II toxin-antitoxin system RelE/ParE family toxin [Pseudomonadota bacterium]
MLHLYAFLLERDLRAAERALKAIELLRFSPFSCRKALPDRPFLRELVIPFGRAGYVALFEIEPDRVITILAVRQQREQDCQ